ncbi:MAG: hypothetical protein JO173_11925 [Gammaproteobacteria bacterium]|nr:hypothetical protein [Gammaproteobacteria bacterium]
MRPANQTESSVKALPQTSGAAGQKSAPAGPPAAARVKADPLGDSVIDDRQLGSARGGAELAQPVNLTLNQNNSNGSVSGNVASNLTTGSNNISDTAFSNSAGVPVVIQNSGNNVLIQNSTILNLQLNAPK